MTIQKTLLISFVLCISYSGCFWGNEYDESEIPKPNVFGIIYDSATHKSISNVLIAEHMMVHDSFYIKGDTILVNSAYLTNQVYGGGNYTIQIADKGELKTSDVHLVFYKPGYRVWKFDAERDTLHYYNRFTAELNVFLVPY
jgi:hypothetical protein